MLTIEDTPKSAYVLTDDFQSDDVEKLNALLAMVDTTGKAQAEIDAYNERKAKWLADFYDARKAS